jgi:hypothetical protein
MLSQPSMQRICRAIPSLALLFLLTQGCGQNEGGRCQVSSDCASGLECREASGNGTCQPKGSTSAVRDAAPSSTSDASPDLALTGTEVKPDATEPDTITADTAAPDAAAADTAESDSGVESEAGSVDTTELDPQP